MTARYEDASPLQTERLALEPLRVHHAEEMAPLLDDARLFAFTGGRPATLAELRARYARQATERSPDGVERWLNWIARRHQDGLAVGVVQATVSADPDPVTAVLAWLVGVRFQRCGYAREAAGAMARWLEGAGVQRFVAYIHPEHEASMAVARALGLAPTDAMVDAEVVWERVAGDP
jgi:RimJ/RimL family protein N-acetyltransferase